MGQKDRFTDRVCGPDHGYDYCTGRFLSLARELAAAGYQHRQIAQASVNVSLDCALGAGPDYFRDFIGDMGTMSMEGTESLIRIAKAYARKNDGTER